MNRHQQSDLIQMQSLPLEAKISMSKRRIREWYDYWNGEVYVSFSGGKDSTVLLHLVRSIYPDVEAVFSDTGLEYPEIRSFVKTFENVTIVRPQMRFDEVIKKYGYPIISKDVSASVGIVKNAKLNDRDFSKFAAWEKLNGEALRKDGEKSFYNKEKWKLL